MKILQIAHAFAPFNTAGVEVYTYNLAKELAKNHQVYIFHRVNQPRQEEYEVKQSRQENLRIYTINNTLKYCYSFRDLYINDAITNNFAKILKEINPDIVHIQHLIYLSTGLIQKIKLRKIPIVFTLHDYWLICPQWHYLKNCLTPCEKYNAYECLSCVSNWLHIHKTPKKIYHFFKKLMPSKLTKKLEDTYMLLSKSLNNPTHGINLINERRTYTKQLSQEVDLFISPSKFLRSKFTDFGIRESKNLLLRHGFNKDLFMNSRRKLSDEITFGFVGTILPAKGLHVLVKAFNDIKNVRARLNIYGKLCSYKGFEYYPKYLKKIKRNQNIYFLGDFENNKVGGIFSSIDILVAPSIWQENAPLIIQEAFLSNTPVLASRIGGIPELVSDGVNGLLFNPGDAQDLKDKIEYVINSPEVIRKFKDNIPRVKSIEENANEIEEIYANLITRNKA